MHFFSKDKYAIIFIYVIQSIFVKYFWLQGTYMLLTCTCTSVSLSACRYSASFYNNSFFDVGKRLNHCFITNYSELLLLLHVHVHVFPYNLDYFRYINLYRFYRFIVLTVPNAHDCDAVHLPSRDSKNLVTMVFMTSLCVDSYEKKKRVEFCCFKRCTRCISIKAFITLKKFLWSWGVFNKMRLYIENVTSIFYSFCFGFRHEIL